MPALFKFGRFGFGSGTVVWRWVAWGVRGAGDGWGFVHILIFFGRAVSRWCRDFCGADKLARLERNIRRYVGGEALS